MTRLGDDVASRFTTGQRAVGTEAVRLLSSVTPVTRGIQVKAAATNVGTVAVGHNANVSLSSGFHLAAGEGLLIKVDDGHKVFLVASVAGQVVEYMVV